MKPWKQPKRARQIVPRTVRLQHFEGKIFVVGKPGKPELRYLVMALDDQVRRFDEKSEQAARQGYPKIGSIRDYYVLIDTLVEPPAFRFRSPEEMERRKAETGLSEGQIMAGMSRPDED